MANPGERKKQRKHRRRAARVPLPRPLCTVKDPDAPFRAYTSDGRELTRADAARWQKRVWQEMQEFIDNGGIKDWDDEDDQDAA